MFFIKCLKIFYENNQTEKYLCHIELCHFLPVILPSIFINLAGVFCVSTWDPDFLAWMESETYQ